MKLCKRLVLLLTSVIAQTLSEEPEVAVQSAIVEALHESLINGGPGCLGSPEKVNACMVALATVTEEVLQRSQLRAVAQKDEDYDEEEVSLLQACTLLV